MHLNNIKLNYLYSNIKDVYYKIIIIISEARSSNVYVNFRSLMFQEAFLYDMQTQFNLNILINNYIVHKLNGSCSLDSTIVSKNITQIQKGFNTQNILAKEHRIDIDHDDVA